MSWQLWLRALIREGLQALRDAADACIDTLAVEQQRGVMLVRQAAVELCTRGRACIHMPSDSPVTRAYTSALSTPCFPPICRPRLYQALMQLQMQHEVAHCFCFP